MLALNINDLNNGSNDLGHIVAVATLANPAATERLGTLRPPVKAASDRAVQDEPRDRPSIKQFGAKGNGKDDTEAISYAAAHFPVSTVPPGNFRYTAAVTDDPAKFDFLPGADFVGMKSGTTSITVRDSSGKVVGFQQNYNEETSPARPITTGNLPWAPLSHKTPVASVDILAHWYNDFGLEAVRVAKGSIGSTKWWSWEWNHTTNTTYGAYDPKRHPMLGWYRGDDPKVLDWQSYWLREYGVKAVILVTEAGFDTASWSNPTDPNRGYWLYQLFNKTPNFKGLGYVINGPFKNVTAAQATDRWNKITDLYLAHPHFYSVDIDDGRYPCIYIFDAGTMRTSVFGGDAPFESWLKSISRKFQRAGYAGVCVMARNGTYYTSAANTARYAKAFGDAGVVMYESTYAWAGEPFGNPATYGGFVDAFDAAYAANKNRVIPNVMTSRNSKYHSTGWPTAGSTPDLFGKVLRKAAQAVRKNPTVPPIVTVYNVAEWGEGGASLQPNMADGFGYLAQLRTVDAAVSPPGASQSSYSGTTVAAGYAGHFPRLINIGAQYINQCDASFFTASGLYQARHYACASSGSEPPIRRR